MSLFFNSITWPWKTQITIRLKPEYYVLFSETPSPHVFQLGIYSDESRITPVFPSLNGLKAYMKHQRPYPLNVEYRPISIKEARERKLKIKLPYALVTPDHRDMPRYIRDELDILTLLGQAGRPAR